jgi:hypothetical protein
MTDTEEELTFLGDVLEDERLTMPVVPKITPSNQLQVLLADIATAKPARIVVESDCIGPRMGVTTYIPVSDDYFLSGDGFMIPVLRNAITGDLHDVSGEELLFLTID